MPIPLYRINSLCRNCPHHKGKPHSCKDRIAKDTGMRSGARLGVFVKDSRGTIRFCHLFPRKLDALSKEESMEIANFEQLSGRNFFLGKTTWP